MAETTATAMEDMGDLGGDASGFEIALIGMAGRFPGARDVDEFWRNLREGIESITFFSKQDLAPRVPPEIFDDPDFVPAYGKLEGIEYFDAPFFGYPPRQAEMMDPQQRLFLECAWSALEDAGYASTSAPAPVGVYAGVTLNSYVLNNLLASPEYEDEADSLLVKLGNDKDFLATRVAYKLNLGGPAITIQTACSTSLVAVHLACQALLSGDCEMALAGGVSIVVPQETGYRYEKDSILSPDGHCRAFDEKAAGTVGGNAVAVVVLKRLTDALADGDEIRAVIKGSAINNDGSDKVGYTAPSVEGQASVIARAHALAGVEPASIRYVETHGTATALGDPIEIAALRQAFRSGSERPSACAIGSVKSNIGHTDAAAGVASLVKTTLALQHRELPPSLHYVRPNPKLELDDGPFYVNAELAPWPDLPSPRRAGVSSFGIGGTNAHVVLEEAPPLHREPSPRPWHLVMWSAASEAALDAASANLAEHLSAHPELDLGDVAHTLQVGRKSFKHRRMAVWRDAEEATRALSDRSFRSMAPGQAGAGDRSILFMFPGQGAQHPNMARELYRCERVFREQLDRCCELLRTPLDCDLREILYPADAELETAAERLQQTRLTQPALFAIEYSLAKLWMAWGIAPRAMIGHSIGEYVAACLSDVFSLEQGLGLVAERGRLMQGLPTGSMLAVGLPVEAIEPLLDEQLDVAGVNEPDGCVVSGSDESIERLVVELQERELSFQRLHTSHAFHSHMMEPILEPFAAEVAKVELSPPRIPFLSNLTGHWITPDEATDPRRWARQMREPVQFCDSVREALRDPERILLEVGPGTTLSTLARRQVDRGAAPRIFSSLPHARASTPETAFMLGTLGQLWLSGVPLSERGLYFDERRRRIPLPTYPFERKRYWVEPQPGVRASTPRNAPGRRPDVSDWFYLPVWTGKPAAAPFEAVAGDDEARSRWLAFVDGVGIGEGIATRLRERGHEVVTLAAGDEVARVSQGAYTIPTKSAEAYGELLDLLERDECFPDAVLHAWAVSRSTEPCEPNLVFHSLIQLARALGKRNLGAPIEIVALSSGVQTIAGEAGASPQKATLLGPCRVIPKEYPQISCRSVDIALPSTRSASEGRLLELLVHELLSRSDDPIVAYRGDHRFTESFEPTPLPAAPRGSRIARERGVYLITGGLGGIGLALAEHLAQGTQARLILLGRSEFPAKQAFREWREGHPANDPISRAIRRIEAIEAAGAEVRIVSADVSDADAMRRALDEARTEFGAIHGVVHSAGVPDGRLIQRRTEEDLEEALAAKIQGTRILDDLLRNDSLDFFVLCSSLASTLGPAGQVGYVAANAFLDAFASARSGVCSGATVSIDWDTWRETGMAVAASQRLAVQGAPRVAPDAVEALAPFDGRIEAEGDEATFVCDFRAERLWVLDEHRIEGTSLLPGTGFVELAASALRQHTGADGVEIHELIFLQPLRVADDEEREVQTALRPLGRASEATKRNEAEQRFEVVVRSRRANARDAWQEHAYGELSPVPNPRPRVLDLEAMQSRIVTPADAGPAVERPRVVEAGQRWDCLASECFQEREGLAMLELPRELESDLAEHPLHPALLDVATSFIVRHFRGEDVYLPYGYKGLRIFRALPSAITSHMTYLASEGDSGDTLRFRITIMDRQGNELISVDEYILRKVDLANFAPLDEVPEEAPGVADLLQDGMSTSEGIEVFDRILSSGYSRVLVSTLDLETRAAHGDMLRAEGRWGGASERRSGHEGRHPRPSLSTPYEEPGSEIQELLVAIWESLLGIEPIGIRDDFLELGGDSLLATQVTARIRSELDIELPIGSLFDEPTVAGLAQRTEALRGATAWSDGEPESDPSEREEFEL